MKKILCLVILLGSCHLPKYTYLGNVNAGLDFNKGRWLMNDIEAPQRIKANLTDIAIEDFTSLLGDRFSTVRDAKGALIPAEIPYNPSKTLLKDIRNGTGFDFFIDIKAKVNRDDIGDLQIGKTYSTKRNSAEVTLTVYDLNLMENIYSQTVVGTLNIDKNSRDFAFAKGANNLIISGFNRIMKKLEKNQVKY